MGGVWVVGGLAWVARMRFPGVWTAVAEKPTRLKDPNMVVYMDPKSEREQNFENHTAVYQVNRQGKTCVFVFGCRLPLPFLLLACFCFAELAFKHGPGNDKTAASQGPSDGRSSSSVI